jgi:hypothetical protein
MHHRQNHLESTRDTAFVNLIEHIIELFQIILYEALSYLQHKIKLIKDHASIYKLLSTKQKKM